MKTCSYCKIEKPESDFGVARSQKSGLRCRCKECEHAADKIWRQNNPEKMRLKSARRIVIERARRQSDPVYREEIREKDRIRHAARPPEMLAHLKMMNRKNTLSREYGLTLEQYARLLESQRNRCAICEKLLNLLGEFKLSSRPNVDHNHKTGEVRGVLCNRCNFLVEIAENEPHKARIHQYIRNPPARAILLAEECSPANDQRPDLVPESVLEVEVASTGPLVSP